MIVAYFSVHHRGDVRAFSNLTISVLLSFEFSCIVLCQQIHFTYRKNSANKTTYTKKIWTLPAHSALWYWVVWRLVDSRLSCPRKDRRSIAVRCWDPLPLQCKHVQHSCCVWYITDCAALMWSCYCHSVYLSTNSVNCCLLHCCGPSCHLYLSASTCSFLSPRLHHVACLLHIQWLSQGNTAYSMHFLCLYF